MSCVPTAMLCLLCRFTDARLADMHALNELDTKAYSFFRWGAVLVLGGKADRLSPPLWMKVVVKKQPEETCAATLQLLAYSAWRCAGTCDLAWLSQLLCMHACICRVSKGVAVQHVSD